MLIKYSKWFGHNKWLAFVVVLSATLFASYGMTGLQFNPDYRSFFNKDYSKVIYLDEIHNEFSKSDNVIFVIETKKTDLFNKKDLQTLVTMTRDVWSIPYASRVESLTNYQNAHAEEDSIYIKDLVSSSKLRTSSNSSYIEAIKRTARSESEIMNRLLSSSGKVTSIHVLLDLPKNDPRVMAEITKSARDLRDRFIKMNPDFNIYITGIVPMNNAFAEASIEDMMSLGPVMNIVIVLTLYILLRSVVATFATLFVIMFSVAAGLGMAGHLGIAITPPSGSTPPMIMTLALADSVHFLLPMLRYYQSGLTKKAAVIKSLSTTARPIVLTSVATIIGFLSMNFSDSPPFRDLGNITAIGIFFAMILTLVVLPCLILLIPIKRSKKKPYMLQNFTSTVAEFSISKKKPIGVVTVLLVIIIGANITKIELNDQFIEYFDRDFEFRADTEFAETNLSGIYSIEFMIDAGVDDGVVSKKYLETLDRFSSWLRRQREVVHVMSFSDVMKKINKNLNGGDESKNILPSNKTLAAQYLFLFEMSLPYGHDLGTQVNISKSASRLVATLDNLSTIQMRDFERRAQVWLDENMPSTYSAISSSPTVMFSHISEKNIRSMLIGTFVALLMVSLVMVVALRNFRLGMLSLIPNLFPTIVAFGAWGILVGQIGLGLSIVAAMSIGIIVDDTVHFISKFQHGIEFERLTVEDAIRYAFQEVGDALIVTTIILSFGFFVLGFSEFQMNSDMGMLTGITLVVALLLDLLFLPGVLLSYMQKDRYYREETYFMETMPLKSIETTSEGKI